MLWVVYLYAMTRGLNNRSSLVQIIINVLMCIATIYVHTLCVSIKIYRPKEHAFTSWNFSYQLWHQAHAFWCVQIEKRIERWCCVSKKWTRLYLSLDCNLSGTKRQRNCCVKLELELSMISKVMSSKNSFVWTFLEFQSQL